MLAFGMSDLVRLPDNPRSGISTVVKKVKLIFDSVDSSSVKENVLQKLNNSKNKYYPDVGGILVGFTNVKLKFDEEVLTETGYHRIVDVKANFYVFRPEAGSQITCVVARKIDGKLVCLARGIFGVEILNLADCRVDDIFVGQTVLVKVEAVEHLAWNDPKILASFIEIADPGGSLIDLVDKFDSDENEDLVDLNASQLSKKRKSTTHSRFRKKKRRIQNVEDLQHQDNPTWLKVDSPLKRNQNQTVDPLLSSCSPKSPSKPTNNNSTPGLETTASIKVYEVAKTPSVEPADAGESSSSGTLLDPVSNPKSNGLSKEVSTIVQDSNGLDTEIANSKSITESVDLNIQPTEVSAVSTSSAPEEGHVKPPSSSKKNRNEAPPGFDDLSTFIGKSKKKRVKLVAPDGTVYTSFKSAWEYVDENPNYLDFGNKEVDRSSEGENPISGNSSLHDKLKPRRQHLDNLQNINGASEHISSAVEQQTVHESKSYPDCSSYDSNKPAGTLPGKVATPRLNDNEETGEDYSSSESSDSDDSEGRRDESSKEDLVGKENCKEPRKKSKVNEDDYNGSSSSSSDSEDCSPQISRGTDKVALKAEIKQTESVRVTTNKLPKSLSGKSTDQSADSYSSSSSETDSETEENASLMVKKPITGKKEINTEKEDVLKGNRKESALSMDRKQAPVTPVKKGANYESFASVKGDSVKKPQAPQLSSTVVKTGKQDLVAVPDGISPISSKTKELSNPLNYFDKMISKPNSSSLKSDSQPESSPSYRAPKKRKSKKSKRIDGFM